MAFDRYGTPIRSAAREMEQRGKTPLVLYCTVLVVPVGAMAVQINC